MTLLQRSDLGRHNFLVFSHFPGSRFKVRFGQSNAIDCVKKILAWKVTTR